MNRDVRFDIMRGVGILLMLLGHVLSNDFAYRWIYSFHMPMFFLLSGLLSHNTALFNEKGIRYIANYSKRILLPFVVTIGAIMLLQIGVCIMQCNTIHVGHVMGPLWFLPALWWAKICMGAINHLPRYAFWVAIGGGLLAFIAGIWITEDRVFLLQGLCAVPFLAIGQWVKDHKLTWWMIAIGIAAWITAVCFSHLDIHGREFGCWPLDIIGACGGTWVLFKVIDYLQRAQWMQRIMRPLAWVGRFSLAMLCMHGLEWKALLPLEEMLCDGTLLWVLRFGVTILLTLMVVYLPGLKKIYR